MRWNILIWCYVGCRYCVISATYNLSFVQICIRIQIKACVYNYEVIAKFTAYGTIHLRRRQFVGSFGPKTFFEASWKLHLLKMSRVRQIQDLGQKLRFSQKGLTTFEKWVLIDEYLARLESAYSLMVHYCKKNSVSPFHRTQYCIRYLVASIEFWGDKLTSRKLKLTWSFKIVPTHFAFCRVKQNWKAYPDSVKKYQINRLKNLLTKQMEKNVKAHA